MGGWVKYVLGIKDCTCHSEHWIIYRLVGFLFCTPETIIIQCAIYTRIKIKI